MLTLCALAFSPDSKLLFSIGKDQMVFIEEIDTGKEILRYKFPKGVVGAASGGSIGSSPDGTLLTIGAAHSLSFCGNGSQAINRWN